MVDNGTSDTRTAKLLNQIDSGSLYDKSLVTVVRLAENEASVAEANNVGIKVALDYYRAEYIAWVEPEAICAPERFKTQLEFFTANPKIDIVGSNVLVFNENY